MAYHERGAELVTIEKGMFSLKTINKALDNLPVDPRQLQMILHFRIATEGRVYAGNCHPFPISEDGDKLQALSTTTEVAIAHNGVLSVPNDEEWSAADNPVPKSKGSGLVPVMATFGWGGSKSRVKGYYHKGDFVPYEWTDQEFNYMYDDYYGTCPMGGTGSYSWQTLQELKYSDTQIFVKEYLAPFTAEVAQSDAMATFIAQFITGKFAIMSKDHLWYIGGFTKDAGRLYSNDSYKTKVAVYNYKSPAAKTPDITKPTEPKIPDPELTARAGIGLGIFIRCGMCNEFAEKESVHECEEMLVCSGCFVAVTRKADTTKALVPLTKTS